MPNASQQSLTTDSRTASATNTDENTSTASSEHTPMPEPSNDNSITIIGGPPNVFRRCEDEDTEDLVETHAPDAYFLSGTGESYAGTQQLSYSLPGNPNILYPGDQHTGKSDHIRVNDIDILVCPTLADIENIAEYERNETLNTDTETVIFSNLLEISLDMDALDASMTGLDAYKEAFNADELTGSYTHISGELDAGYCQEWDGLLIRGAGMGDGNGGSFISLTITPEGHVLDETIDTSKLGMKAIQGVGPTTADRLKEAGYDTQEIIADAGVDELMEIDGFGEKKATQVKQSATALTHGKIVPTSDSQVPGHDPVFIDIETDGLNPTCVWLIGVQDGIDGNYMSFIETDVDEAGQAIEAFMMWFSVNAADRKVMAWNGWNFDFPVLREHIQKHCPEYLDDWKRASKRDPLRWARDLDNVILPGRTNKLEHVAEALGWEDNGTGLSGGEVARRYRQFLENPCEETELEWDRHKRYCQDDCEALERIYVAMQDSSRLETTDIEESMDVEEETAQGSLFESY